MAYDVIHRENGSWQVRIRLPQLKALIGKSTYHETFDSEKEARYQGARLHARFLSGLIPQDCHIAQVTLGDVLDKYLMERVPEMRGATSEASRIRKMKAAMGHLCLPDITIKFLEEYKATRLGPPQVRSSNRKAELYATNYLRKQHTLPRRAVKPQTVRHELGTLRRALKHFGYAEEIDLSRHAIMHVRLPSKSPELFRSISDEQVKLISEHSESAVLGKAVTFMIETAMRRAELVSLRWEDCHIDQGYVVLHDTKSPREETRESRAVPLTPHARDILRSMVPDEKCGPVWPITKDALTKAFGRAKERAGIKGVRLYDARHEGTTRLFDQGLNTMEVAAITGHKELRTLKRYTHLSAERLAKKLRSNCGPAVMKSVNEMESVPVLGEWNAQEPKCLVQENDQRAQVSLESLPDNVLPFRRKAG